MASSPLSGEDLIERYIDSDPNLCRDPRARVRDHGVEVWAVIGYWRGQRLDTEEAAEAFELSSEAMQAVLAYYRQHQALIDAKLLVNSA